MGKRPAIVLTGQDFVQTNEVGALIAGALHPPEEGEQVVVGLSVEAKPQASARTKQRHNWPIAEEEQEILDRAWADLPPLCYPCPISQFQTYLDAFHRNADVDWDISPTVQTPALQAQLRYYSAKREHERLARTSDSWKHGRRSRQMLDDLRLFRELIRWCEPVET